MQLARRFVTAVCTGLSAGTSSARSLVTAVGKAVAASSTCRATDSYSGYLRLLPSPVSFALLQACSNKLSGWP